MLIPSHVPRVKNTDYVSLMRKQSSATTWFLWPRAWLNVAVKVDKESAAAATEVVAAAAEVAAVTVAGA